MRLMPIALPLLAGALACAAPVLAALAPGAAAPDFTTRGAMAGKVFQVHLKEQLKKGPVVLYFFPAAYTGGCNAEAHAFAEAIPQFQAAGATVIGMSSDDVPTLQRFSAEKCAASSRWPAPARRWCAAMMSRWVGRWRAVISPSGPVTSLTALDGLLSSMMT